MLTKRSLSACVLIIEYVVMFDMFHIMRLLFLLRSMEFLNQVADVSRN